MNERPFTIIVDSREQTPFSFPAGLKIEVATLKTGDYSLKGLTDLCAIERKSLPDLIKCCTYDRDRFKAELHRLQSYQCRCVIIEANLNQIVKGDYRSKVSPHFRHQWPHFLADKIQCPIHIRRAIWQPLLHKAPD